MRTLRSAQALALVRRRASGCRSARCAPRRPTAPASGRRRTAPLPSRARRSGPCRGRCRTGSSRACCNRRGRRARSSPTGPCTRARPPNTPSAIEWSPPSTSGSSPASQRAGDVVGDLAADVEDLVEVLGMRVALGQRLDRVLGHRAEIAHADAQLREPPARAPRSGSPMAPCRHRAAPARGRAQLPVRRPAGAAAVLTRRSRRAATARAGRPAPPARPARRSASLAPREAPARPRPPRPRAGRPRRGPIP